MSKCTETTPRLFIARATSDRLVVESVLTFERSSPLRLFSSLSPIKLTAHIQHVDLFSLTTLLSVPPLSILISQGYGFSCAPPQKVTNFNFVHIFSRFANFFINQPIVQIVQKLISCQDDWYYLLFKFNVLSIIFQINMYLPFLHQSDTLLIF